MSLLNLNWLSNQAVDENKHWKTGVSISTKPLEVGFHALLIYVLGIK